MSKHAYSYQVACLSEAAIRCPDLEGCTRPYALLHAAQLNDVQTAWPRVRPFMRQMVPRACQVISDMLRVLHRD